MWKNSTELFNHALQRLKEAEAQNNKKVEIVLMQGCTGEEDEIKKMGDKFAIKMITANLREEFKDYTIKSVLETKGPFSMILCSRNKSCVFYYPLVWKLTLHNKEK